MFRSVDQCMAAPNVNVRDAAKKAGVEYITLDTQEGKLSVCKEITTLHTQPVFTKKGVNPLLKKTLLKQEQQCSGMCKA
jgi:hypothetical protein